MLIGSATDGLQPEAGRIVRRIVDRDAQLQQQSHAEYRRNEKLYTSDG